MDLAAVTSVAIHPAIGIARVGNSPDTYFLAPEIPGTPAADRDEFRDPQQRIKRQVARFRVFGLDARGHVLGEITAAHADIAWSVHVANTKAAWFRFDTALDIPVTEGKVPQTPAMASMQRNQSVKGRDRSKLRIDPGVRRITGCNTNAAGSEQRYAFTGSIFTQQVYLGELRTDEAGRLLCFGGRGVSGPWNDSPLTPGEFANNDGWYDDVADGPVDARVRINGRTLRATGAWLVVAPPDYAPGIQAIVSGYDLVLQAAARQWPECLPQRPSFSRHIYPLLARMTAYQWVNRGFCETFGWGSPLDFSDASLIAMLASHDEARRSLRASIARRFRDPSARVVQVDAWPAVYGDNMRINPAGTEPLQFMSVLPMQFDWLNRWADGDFDADWPPHVRREVTAAGLDQAALENATGGPFHPGAEFTWPMRHPMLYSAPFRIKRRRGDEPDWGEQLTSSKVLAKGGVLDGSGPGDITRWMACPWQADTSSCLSAYSVWGGQYLPTFWPARVPNDVLTEEDWKRIADAKLTTAERLRALDPVNRAKWLRGIVYPETGNATQIHDGRQAFIDDGWWHVGIVVRRDGPKEPPLFPPDIWVETHRAPPRAPAGEAMPLHHYLPKTRR